MTTFNTPDHPYEQNELNKLDFCKCGVHKRFHVTQFIKSQQELAKDGISSHVLEQVTFLDSGISVGEYLDTLIARIITNTGEELMRLVSGLEEEYQNDPLAVAAGMEDIKLNAVEDIKQHITNVTGVE